MNIEKIEKLAQQWVEAHSHKWSNNNNEVGDNYGSFIEGYRAAEKELPTWDDVSKAIIMSATSPTDNLIDRCEQIINHIKKK